MIYHVTIGDTTRVVELGPDGVTVDGSPVDVDFERLEGGPIRSLVIDGQSHRLSASRGGSERWDGGQKVLKTRVNIVSRPWDEQAGWVLRASGIRDMRERYSRYVSIRENNSVGIHYHLHYFVFAAQATTCS